MTGHRPQNCSCRGMPLLSVIFADDDDDPPQCMPVRGQRPLPTPKGRQLTGATPPSRNRWNKGARGADVQSSMAPSVDPPAAADRSDANRDEHKAQDVAEWACEACTVVNTGADKTCAVCGADKPGEKQETSTRKAKQASDAKSVLSKSSGGMGSSAASALASLVGKSKRRADDTNAAASSASNAASIPAGAARRREDAMPASPDRQDEAVSSTAPRGEDDRREKRGTSNDGSKGGSSNNSKGGSSNTRPKGESKSVFSGGQNSASNASAVLGPMLKAKPKRRET